MKNSTSTLVIASVCIAFALSVITGFFLPIEAIRRLNELNQMVTIDWKALSLADYLLVFMPMMYWGLAFAALYKLNQKYPSQVDANT